MDRAEFKDVVSRSEGSPLAILAAGTGLAAGILHLIVTPMHFAEHLAHGLFMATLGTWQVVWALWFFRRHTPASFAAGVLTMVASLVTWLFVTFITSPFEGAPETPEPIAYVTKVVELLALVALVVAAFPRGAGRSVLRPATTLVVAALLVGVFVGGAAWGAGLVAQDAVPALGNPATSAMDGGSMTTASTGASAASGTNAGAMAMNASTNASTNASAPAASDPGAPTSPENCMVGMDMPGCTSAQAEARYKQAQENASRAPPDKPLAPLKIALTPQGESPVKAAVDGGTMQLNITVYLNDTGTGPYAGSGSMPGSDITVTLKSSDGSQSKIVDITGSAGYAGVDPAQPGHIGPITASIVTPASGDWSVSVDGTGQNLNVIVDLVEHFSLV